MHQLAARLPLTETAFEEAIPAQPAAAPKVDFAQELGQEIHDASESILTDSGEVNFTNLYLAVASKGPKAVLRDLAQ